MFRALFASGGGRARIAPGRARRAQLDEANGGVIRVSPSLCTA